MLLGPNHPHPEKVDFVDVCTPLPRQGGPAGKKVPLGIRLKSTRPSHGRFWSRSLPREAKQLSTAGALVSGMGFALYGALYRYLLGALFIKKRGVSSSTIEARTALATAPLFLTLGLGLLAFTDLASSKRSGEGAAPKAQRGAFSARYAPAARNNYVFSSVK